MNLVGGKVSWSHGKLQRGSDRFRWLLSRVSRNFPYRAVSVCREQAAQTGGAQAAVLVRGEPEVRPASAGVDSDWGGGWKDNLGLSMKGSAGQAKELGL